MRSLLPHDIAKPGHCSQGESLRNSILLWNEQPVLVGRMGPRVRGIHRSGSVLLFRESWRKCVILCRLSLSMWFVCLSPLPISSSYHSSSIWTVTFSHCMLFKSCLCLCVWDPSMAMYRYQQFLKNEIENKSKTPFFDPSNVSTANFLQRSAADMPSMRWNDVSVVMSTIYTHYTMLFHNFFTVENGL